MQQPKLAFMPHHYATKNESFLRKKLYFCRHGASVRQPEPPPFARHQHNNIEKKRIDNGKLEI